MILLFLAALNNELRPRNLDAHARRVDAGRSVALTGTFGPKFWGSSEIPCHRLPFGLSVAIRGRRMGAISPYSLRPAALRSDVMMT